MATGVAAGRLVVDGRDHVEGFYALRRTGITNPRIFGRMVADAAFGVTAGTYFAGGGSNRLRLAGIGRENEAALLVVHAYTINSLLVGDHAHDLVGGPAIVVQHGKPGG